MRHKEVMDDSAHWPGAAADGHEGRLPGQPRALLWFLVAVTIGIAWWIAAMPVVCAAGGVTVAYPACPSGADVVAAASLVTIGYVVVAGAGTLALTHPRARRLGIIVLVAAAVAAVPAWLWVAHPVM